MRPANLLNAKDQRIQNYLAAQEAQPKIKSLSLICFVLAQMYIVSFTQYPPLKISLAYLGL